MGVAVTFADDNAAVRVDPGGQASCLVRVENTGSVVDGILLDLLGDAAEWASVEPAEVNLLPGASASASIVFRPPRTAALAPGEVPFGLRAMSREDPDGSRIEEGVVQVGDFSDLDASLVPKTATGRRSARFRLIVENRGNRPEELTVQAADPDVKLAFLARPEVFIAPPGTATFVRVKAVPRKTFFKGPNRSLPFEVTALPDDGSPVRAAGVMLEKQTLPEWLLPLLGIAVVLAGLVLALWLTVLRPIVHSAATAAAMASKAAGSAKNAANAAKSHASPSPPAAPSALNVTLPAPTLLTRTTELATVTGSFRNNGAGALPGIVWTSSAPKVARVSQNGVVTGIRPGPATITATTVSKARPRSTAGPSPSASPGAAHATVAAAGRPVLSGSATVNVVAKVKVSAAPLAEAAIGKPYSTSLNASGGTGSFTWSVSGGSLPVGLSLSPASGAITGTPAKLGTSSFTVHVADAGPPTQFAAGTLKLRVARPLAVTTSTLPGGMVGGGYRSSLAAVGGTPPYTWSISPGTGTLPGGLKLNPATGAITGTPTSAGPSNFLVQVTDAASPSQSSTEALSVNVVNPLTLSTLTLPSGVLDSAYAQTLTAFGGAQPYAWSVSAGSLPAGLALGHDSGTLAGTPTATGPSTFTIQVTDADQPGLSVSRTFTVSVVNAFVATTSSLPQGRVGLPYTAQLSATGGVTPYVWTLRGTLPPGLTLSPGGTLTGTPTATGIFPFTVQAVDSSSPPLSVTASLSITVIGSLRITTSSLREAVTGVAYSQTVGAVGGTPPYTWSVTSGSLPSGLTLSPDTGSITGTPVSTGTSTFTVSAADSDAPPSHASLSTSITVVEPLVFSEPKLVDAVTGNAYGPITPTHVSGGSGQYVWSITSGVLPAGLSLDPATGTIGGQTGARAALGDQNFTLTLADALDPALTDSQQETIHVVGQLTLSPPRLAVTAGVSVSQDLSADVSGGRAPYTFSSPGIDGLTVNATTGVISGIPDAPCSGGSQQTLADGSVEVTCAGTTFQTVLTVTDANGNSVSSSLVVDASIAPMFFDPVSSLKGVADARAYNEHTVVNGTPPSGGYGPAVSNVGGYTFSTSDTPGNQTPNNNGLPCDTVGGGGCSTGELGISPSNGDITGTVTAVVVNQTWTFKVIVTDVDPLNPVNKMTGSFTLSITAVVG